MWPLWRYKGMASCKCFTYSLLFSRDKCPDARWLPIVPHWKCLALCLLVSLWESNCIPLVFNVPGVWTSDISYLAFTSISCLLEFGSEWCVALLCCPIIAVGLLQKFQCHPPNPLFDLQQVSFRISQVESSSRPCSSEISSRRHCS